MEFCLLMLEFDGDVSYYRCLLFLIPLLTSFLAHPSLIFPDYVPNVATISLKTLSYVVT